jgi:uncharacterized protein YbjT (DUF2867 family)
MSDGQTALVTGVSGQVAGEAAERLSGGGYQVRALVRSPDQAAAAPAAP